MGDMLRKIDKAIPKHTLYAICAAMAVAILALTVVMLAQDAAPQKDAVPSPGDVVSEADTVPETDYEYLDINWEENPIDDFLARYELSENTSSNADMSAYHAAVSDLWLVEVEHGYDLLKDSLNSSLDEERREYWEDNIDRTLESFLLYADESSHLEATAAASNVFVSEEYDGTDIMAGTALGGYHMGIRAELHRQEALRVYAALEWVLEYESVEEAFVFDEEEFLSTVTEFYDIELVPVAAGE